ncbi:MAG TPA: hypothetical protein VKR61_03535 [Bryobacteraceae bacterium]|nr:hypothetical protein [Bryobacteraceae bacterium]
MVLERLAVLIGGFAAGTLMRRWLAGASAPGHALERATRELKSQARAHESRISRLEARTDSHEARLKEVPSTAQLVAALDDLLAKALTGLEGRLTVQAQSIETLQMTVAQTDELLERVLESLDTLRDMPPAN